ncbi:hypothetical protein HYG81_17000 [Natrinema zhouii]|uniref:MarR family transcriptional regulator n=1 Tax=Natrinema zhouii TaxID=1710539 RepID=A0A7D6CNB1_9EURY|nr:hypothetical protein [Natrinema zhouii]QLK25755.1 hypothetical protein HYG81_17000 [Natrinema zhouii]
MPREPFEHVLADGPLTKWEIVDITGIPIDLVEITLRDQEALGTVERTNDGWQLCNDRVQLIIRGYQ